MTMKTFSLVVLICLLVAVRPAAAAQPAEDSLLVRYRRMALDCDDDLRAAAKRIEASAELERAARAERIPTLSAGTHTDPASHFPKTETLPVHLRP